MPDRSHLDSAYDEYEAFEEQFDPLRHNRRARRARKPRVKHTPRQAQQEAVEELAETAIALEGGFQTTYQPSKYEAEWLLSSLESFYDEHLITDVVALVKGGKEASVYQCAADPSTGVEWLAAKVYRPRQFRALRNDSLYREGREVLTPDGRPVKKNDHRVMRAIGKKSSFGVQVSQTSWLMYEYTTLNMLHAAGGAVPRPFGANDNAILMGYCGDAQIAAPLLSEVRLEPDEAPALFGEVLRNIELMLAQGFVHGDLSAYNILYWDGTITLIDFPQVVAVQGNRNAYFILQRDIQRVCEYFARQGVRRDAATLLNELWLRQIGWLPDQRAAEEAASMGIDLD